MEQILFFGGFVALVGLGGAAWVWMRSRLSKHPPQTPATSHTSSSPAPQGPPSKEEQCRRALSAYLDNTEHQWLESLGTRCPGCGQTVSIEHSNEQHGSFAGGGGFRTYAEQRRCSTCGWSRFRPHVIGHVYPDPKPGRDLKPFPAGERHTWRLADSEAGYALIKAGGGQPPEHTWLTPPPHNPLRIANLTLAKELIPVALRVDVSELAEAQARTLQESALKHILPGLQMVAEGKQLKPLPGIPVGPPPTSLPKPQPAQGPRLTVGLPVRIIEHPVPANLPRSLELILPDGSVCLTLPQGQPLPVEALTLLSPEVSAQELSVQWSDPQQFWTQLKLLEPTSEMLGFMLRVTALGLLEVQVHEGATQRFLDRLQVDLKAADHPRDSICLQWVGPGTPGARPLAPKAISSPSSGHPPSSQPCIALGHHTVNPRSFESDGTPLPGPLGKPTPRPGTPVIHAFLPSQTLPWPICLEEGPILFQEGTALPAEATAPIGGTPYPSACLMWADIDDMLGRITVRDAPNNDAQGQLHIRIKPDGTVICWVSGDGLGGCGFVHYRKPRTTTPS